LWEEKEREGEEGGKKGGKERRKGERERERERKRDYFTEVGVAQVVEILPSKCKALSSNPRTTKKEDQKKHWPKTSQILSGLYNS
jgi:hypothetical protein